MKLNISTIADDRVFARAMRRVEGRFRALVDEFAKIELADPIHETLLVSLTNTVPRGHFEEIPNDEGIFQVSAGCDSQGGDDELARQILEALRLAVEACPFTRVDRQSLQALLDRHERTLFGGK